MALGVLLGGAAAARASSRWRAGAAWLVWTATILAVTVPWGDVHAHAHWQNLVVTMPLTRHAVADVIANVLLYVPFGYWRRRGPTGAGWTVAEAGVLASAVELTQLMSHSRIPSLVDVASNTAGAIVGVWLRRSAGGIVTRAA